MRRVVIAFLLGCIHFSSGQTCDDGWAEFGGNCYFVNSGLTGQPDINWHAARDVCVAEGGELASVHSQEEQDFILTTSGSVGHTGDLWLGLNQLADREGDYGWSDGSTVGYDFFAPDEPNRDGHNQCVYSKGTTSSNCFTRDPGINTVDGLFSHPSGSRPPDTHYFGYRPAPDDPDWCQEECSKEKNCHTFTFITNNHPDNVWKGECMGANIQYDINEPDVYAISGRRTDCGEDPVGIWYSNNCGMNKGYVCKKSPGSAPGTVPPTAPTPGFCPQGWFGADNKCYKIVEVDTDFEGLSWEDARDACRAEEGYLPDLASFHTLKEQSVVIAQLQMYMLGLWIGSAREGEYADWVWSDNSRPDDFTYWAEGEPSWGDEHCVELLIHRRPIGMWNNFPCHEKRGYVCQSWKDSSNPIMSPAPTTPHGCPEGYTYHWYGCYKYVPTPTTWVEAEMACAQEQGHLASIHAEAENAALLVLTDGAEAWIGFRRGGDDEFRWTDGWPTRYQRWDEGQPSDQDDCALINGDLSWDSSDCDATYPYICKTTDVPRPTTPAIGDGVCPSTKWKMYGEHCYYFATDYSYPEDERASWGDALEQCVRFGQGHSHPSSLASIHSWPENEFIYNTLDEIRGGDSYYVTRAWIGLSKKEWGAPFVWTDGTPFDFTAWMPGEPNDQDGSENCVEMYVEAAPGLWNDHFCTQIAPFVCKTRLGEAPPTPTLPPDVPGNCPENGDWEAYGAYCYLFMPDEYTMWDEAHGECKRLGGSIANLASIHSGSENAWITNRLVDKSNMPVRRGAWIGLKKQASDTEWSWIEPEQEFTYQNWEFGAGDPSSPNNCVQLSSEHGMWADVPCTGLLGYVCRAEKVQARDLEISPAFKRLLAHLGYHSVQDNLPMHVPEENKSSTLGIVFGTLGCLLVAVGIVAGVIVVKRRAKKREDSTEMKIATIDMKVATMDA